jgi:hypothetical protein
MESCSGTFKAELEMKPYENDGLARKEVVAHIRCETKVPVPLLCFASPRSSSKGDEHAWRRLRRSPRGGEHGTSLGPPELRADVPIRESMARSVSRSRVDIAWQSILLGQREYRALLLPQLPKCHGNALELWAAAHKLGIYEAALDLCRALGRDVPWINRW